MSAMSKEEKVYVSAGPIWLFCCEKPRPLLSTILKNLNPMDEPEGEFEAGASHWDAPNNRRKSVTISIQVSVNGNYKVPVTVPNASHFFEWFNPEGPTGDTLEEFAQQYAESEGAGEGVHVGMGDWSHTEIFAVQITDGKATLVSAGTA